MSSISFGAVRTDSVTNNFISINSHTRMALGYAVRRSVVNVRGQNYPFQPTFRDFEQVTERTRSTNLYSRSSDGAQIEISPDASFNVEKVLDYDLQGYRINGPVVEVSLEAVVHEAVYTFEWFSRFLKDQRVRGTFTICVGFRQITEALVDWSGFKATENPGALWEINWGSIGRSFDAQNVRFPLQSTKRLVDPLSEIVRGLAATTFPKKRPALSSQSRVLSVRPPSLELEPRSIEGVVNEAIKQLRKSK